MQDNYVIASEIMKLNEHENSYIVYDIKLAAVIHALENMMELTFGQEIYFSNRSYQCDMFL